jgi:predicted AAA+ superfamily ATPase
MYARNIQTSINEYLNNDSHKIFFIWGPRRSGKTTILKQLSHELNIPIFNFDVTTDQEKFIPNRETLQNLASSFKIILIDEVQSYPESTLALKILFDEFNVKIIATGSSELRQKSTNFDSLSGRFTEHYCLPLSISEIQENNKTKDYQLSDFQNKLQTDIQIYGSYPEVYIDSNKTDLLQNILDTYILKDVVNIYNLKDTKLAKDILTKIALQIGSEVSLREIANSLNANVVTVSNYIEIFIKNYILIPLPSFKTNLRRAVSENRKLYFYDLGIRNILVRDFRPLNLRPDSGGVFENFIVSEIEKQKRNKNIQCTIYFYREYSGQEVDLVIEDYQKRYTCIEIKSNINPQFKNIFPLPHKLIYVTPKNYYDEIFNLN